MANENFTAQQWIDYFMDKIDKGIDFTVNEIREAVKVISVKDPIAVKDAVTVFYTASSLLIETFIRFSKMLSSLNMNMRRKMLNFFQNLSASFCLTAVRVLLLRARGKLRRVFGRLCLAVLRLRRRGMRMRLFRMLCLTGFSRRMS